MSGMFQRIARRHADRSEGADAGAADAERDAAATPPAGGDGGSTAPPAGDSAADAPTERIAAVEAPGAAPADQPTTYRPVASPPGEQATNVRPGVALPATGDRPAAHAPSTSTDQAHAAAQEPAGAGGSPLAEATAIPAAATAAAAQAAAPEATAPQAQRAGFRARGRMRRRLRYLRKLRELQVRDLGGLVFDLRRFERKRDDLVAQKVDHIRACDDELHALELALAERRELRDVREPGIGGTCPRCFAVFGSADRFCSHCGAALGGAVQGPAQVPVAAAPQPAPAQSSAAPPAAPPQVGGPPS